MDVLLWHDYTLYLILNTERRTLKRKKKNENDPPSNPRSI